MKETFTEYPGSISIWRANFPIITVRIVNPLSSSIPNNNVICRNSAYLVIDGVPIIISKLYKSNYNSYEYPEISWLFKEEIRIISSLNLSRSYGSFDFFLDKGCKIIQYKDLQSGQNNERKSLKYVLDEVLEVIKDDVKNLRFEKRIENYCTGEMYEPEWGELLLNRSI